MEEGRRGYKLSVLSAAIDPAPRPYVKVPDTRVSALLNAYRELALTYPDLRMTTPTSGGSGSDWVYFAPPRAGTDLLHKLDKGVVDLSIRSAADRIGELRERNLSILEQGVQLVPTGKSASFRILVPRVDRLASPDGQQEAMRAGLAAAHRLAQLAGGISGI
jgi:hypothetical protein